jgi:adenine-specific DNA-methyltransferase
MIRSELDVLLDRIEDPALRADLQAQIDRLKQRRSFGLVFEQHIPERVRLPQHPIRMGSQVVSRDEDDSPTYEVVAIEDGLATLVLTRDANGAYVPRGEHPVGERERMALDSLVVITDFGEPVLPGFRYLGAAERGGDKPYHVVINGENHHALEALRFTHAGKVDCIYIDPPYNSGARDWKYNNDYVDETDAYRHSKWLAFMERRLKLAKELLNPDDSVLIVTIDEREYLRLGMLLGQTFAGLRSQMVSTIIKPEGTNRFGEFSRTNEFIFFVMSGEARVVPTTDDMSGRSDSRIGAPLEWRNLRRRENSSTRSARPNQFYAVFVDPRAGAIHSIGNALPLNVDRHSIVAPDGCFALFPLKPDGTEMLWGVTPDRLRGLVAEGYARVANAQRGAMEASIQYLPSGTVEAIRSGRVVISGIDAQGAVIGQFADQTVMPKTTWNKPSHNAQTSGTLMVSALLPRRRFPFPKSLYAVEDTIRFFVKDKPAALVLDFFAGSGTTAQAVMRLNRQDGGRRQSILVTNNEVSAEEAAELRRQGRRPGDEGWESLGIFEHITRPRVTAAITGKTPDGEPIKGDYKFTDEFPVADGFEENAAFLELRYLDADDVDLGMAYDEIAPMLWMRSGATGPVAKRTDDAGTPVPYAWTERYGVLFDEDRWRSFVADCPPTAAAAFIVTNSPTTFASIVAELPTGMDTVRLYDTYLSMFQPERGRA